MYFTTNVQFHTHSPVDGDNEAHSDDECEEDDDSDNDMDDDGMYLDDDDGDHYKGGEDDDVRIMTMHQSRFIILVRHFWRVGVSSADFLHVYCKKYNIHSFTVHTHSTLPYIQHTRRHDLSDITN